MVKPVQKAEINSFVKGLISESSPLNFPPDAEKDGENFDLNKDGSRQRRLGVDLESGYTVLSTGYTAAQIEEGNAAISSFKWVGANKNPNNEFGVVQFGNKLDVFDLAQDIISTDGFIGSVSITGADPSTAFSYSVVDGYLVITAGIDTVQVIEWDGVSLTQTTDRLLVRDLWGLPGLDNNDINTRPTTLSDDHLYNLRNQGWGIPRKNSAGTLTDPLNVYFTTYSKYPANSEVVYTGLEFQPVTGGSTFERIYPNLYEEQLGLEIKAARGYFIIDALRRGISRKTVVTENNTKYPQLTYSVSNLKTDITEGGASIVADFAGRAFYAGFNGTVTDGDENSPNLSGYVLFSQVVKSKGDLIKCYQAGDPTSREGSDIVDTDGGFIRISGAKKIIGLKAMANNLFVIADNGVWVIAGGSDFGFTATNYRVDKLSSFGCISNKTITEVNDQVFFWGEEGIFRISRNQFGDWTVNNIAENTIQKIYDAIPSQIKRETEGTYDALDKKIRWLYTIEGVTRELILDLVLGSFSKNRIYNLEVDSPKVIAFINTPSFNEAVTQDQVVVSLDDVQVVGEDVTVVRGVRLSRTISVKFVTLYGMVADKAGYTFAYYKDADFIDWFSADFIGVDAKAYILTGSMTAGDSSIYKQVPYLVMHFLKTEEGVDEVNGELIPLNQSSCIVRSQWNWSDSINSGNWSSTFQAYRYRKPLFITDISDEYDNGFEVVSTKNKLRGRGRALSIYLETEPLKDCRVLGWNLSLTGNSLT